MMPRMTFVLFAFGLLLQSCSLQKRSLMPGWHVERTGHAAADVRVKAPDGKTQALAQSSAKPVQLASSFAAPPAPLSALQAAVPTPDVASELKMPVAMQRAKVRAPLRLDRDVPSRGEEPPEQPAGDDGGRKRRRIGVTIAAVLGIGSVFAFRESNRVVWRPTARRLKWLGAGLIALALAVLRFAFPYAAPESHEQPPKQKEGRGKRIAMGVLAGVLGIASIPAISLGFFDLSLWWFALVGFGLLYLALRALIVAFPNAFPRLRARLINPDKPDEPNEPAPSAREQPVKDPDAEPSRNWLWLLALIPVGLLILVVSSLSFPAFGM